MLTMVFVYWGAFVGGIRTGLERNRDRLWGSIDDACGPEVGKFSGFLLFHGVALSKSDSLLNEQLQEGIIIPF